MTRKEEIHLLNNIERIRDETHENNIMLKQIIKVINYYISNSNNDDIKDFGINVLANIISNKTNKNDINGNINKYYRHNIKFF